MRSSISHTVYKQDFVYNKLVTGCIFKSATKNASYDLRIRTPLTSVLRRSSWPNLKHIASWYPHVEQCPHPGFGTSQSQLPPPSGTEWLPCEGIPHELFLGNPWWSMEHNASGIDRLFDRTEKHAFAKFGTTFSRASRAQDSMNLCASDHWMEHAVLASPEWDMHALPWDCEEYILRCCSRDCIKFFGLVILVDKLLYALRCFLIWGKDRRYGTQELEVQRLSRNKTDQNRRWNPQQRSWWILSVSWEQCLATPTTKSLVFPWITSTEDPKVHADLRSRRLFQVISLGPSSMYRMSPWQM